MNKPNLSTDDALKNMMRIMKFKKAKTLTVRQKSYFQKWLKGEQLYQVKKKPFKQIGKTYSKERIKLR